MEGHWLWTPPGVQAGSLYWTCPGFIGTPNRTNRPPFPTRRSGAPSAGWKGCGAPEHPGWYKNLVAHPDVDIQVWDKVIPVTARTGTAADKKRAWPIMVAHWPGYDEYQAGTPRDIPVVLLRPRETLSEAAQNARRWHRLKRPLRTISTVALMINWR
jgi:hypothetical protein